MHANAVARKAAAVLLSRLLVQRQLRATGCPLNWVLDPQQSSMVLHRVFDVPTPAEFASALAAAQEISASLRATVLVLTTSDAPGGQPWCPDCRLADPIMLEMISGSEAGFVLVRAVCRREEYSGKSNFPYRKDAQLRLSAIPTLIRWTATGAGNRLVESQCARRDLVALLLSDDGEE